MTIRKYSELMQLGTFEDRVRYLELKGKVGAETFGFDRYINQVFYKSKEWRAIRDYVLIRDFGCDLGMPGFEIFINPLVHHMNPITRDDILNREEDALNPEYLITVSHNTHNIIHYGVDEYVEKKPREYGDTKLW